MICPRTLGRFGKSLHKKKIGPVMLRSNSAMICFLLGSVLFVVGESRAQKRDESGSNWHQWRGPEANGVSRTAKPPLLWSEFLEPELKDIVTAH